MKRERKRRVGLVFWLIYALLHGIVEGREARTTKRLIDIIFNEKIVQLLAQKTRSNFSFRSATLRLRQHAVFCETSPR
jgi:hypothetical protein